MHHRSSAAATTTTTTTVRTTTPTTVISTTNTKRTTRKIRRKKKRRSSSFFSNDLVVAVAMTVVLTVVVCLLFVKLIGYVTGSSSKHEQTDDWSETVIPFNPKYRVRDSIETVGDRSDEYVSLRQHYDALLPPNPARSLQAVSDIVGMGQTYYGLLQPAPMDMHDTDQVPYDIYNCPETPPAGYPFAWNMMTVLTNWSPDDTSPPTSNQIYQGLCVFDYQHDGDYDKALTYRSAELPFVMVNDPDVAAVVERWNQPGYMSKMLGNVQHRTEYSENNHFMYYVPVPKNKKRQDKNKKRILRAPEGWTPPTKMIRMNFDQWLHKANVTDDDKLGPDNPHWYYRLIGCGGMGRDGSCDSGSSEYLFDELPFFQPRETLYVVEPEEQKGIHCRFGMKGVIAENHYDGSRNSIAVLSGSRRYILTHPDQCEKLALYPRGHPSARHSAVDWSNPDLDEFPDFATAKTNEVVLSAGQVLYLPTQWFHYIVSLELNYQCNTRSGISEHYQQHIKKCGFPH